MEKITICMATEAFGEDERYVLLDTEAGHINISASYPAGPDGWWENNGEWPCLSIIGNPGEPAGDGQYPAEESAIVAITKVMADAGVPMLEAYSDWPVTESGIVSRAYAGFNARHNGDDDDYYLTWITFDADTVTLLNEKCANVDITIKQ